MLRTSVDAFCSQAVGFVFVRVAGITALHVTVECNGQTLFDRKFERVVTDAEPEYTGSSFTTVEQAMTTTMGDSLRELLSQMLSQIDAAAATWEAAAAPKQEPRSPDTQPLAAGATAGQPSAAVQ